MLKTFNKYSSLILIFVVLLSLCMGCTKRENSQGMATWYEENGKLKVLSTIAMIDDVVKQVGGDYIEAMALIQGELDPHSYELVKGDDDKFARADVIFYNGLGLEHGWSLRQNLERNPKAISLGDPLLFTDPNSILKVDGQYDPHIWMDMALWTQTIETIVKALSEKDPLHAADYEAQGQKVLAQMQKADEEIFNRLQSIPEGQRYLVTSHDAFNYFVRHYLSTPEEKIEGTWKARCAAPEGLAPDAQLSIADLKAIIDHVVKYQIKVLFPEANVSRDSLKKILQSAKEKGINLRLCESPLYGDSMGTETYIEMITHNAEVIASSLGGQTP